MSDVRVQTASHWRKIRRCAPWVLAFWFATAGLGEFSPARAQAASREYKLKAAFLYKFATYVRWPEEAFADVGSPLVIGVLGPDPVGADLRKIAAVKTIEGRRIEIRNFKEVKEVGRCHVLFISRGVDGEAQAAALKQLGGRNILLVGESRDFLKKGGVVNFVIQENRVRIFISKLAYERQGLNISAHLLRVAAVGS